MTLRMVLRPLIEFKVTIMRDDSPMYALQKALVVTRTSTILNSVVEVNIGRSTDRCNDFLRSYKVPFLLTPAFNTLVNAIPAMQHLHTIRLSDIFLSSMYIYTILSSPHLVHLILTTVQLPKISTFPPPKLRKLTLVTMRCSWNSIQPLIAQLATSLEYLELDWCRFLPPSQIQLPSLPCLQELRHHQYYLRNTFPGENQLNELLRLGSQVTRLHVSGHESVTACRKSLQYLDTSIWMLSDLTFGTEPFPRLMHLSLRVFQTADTANHLLTFPSFIRDHFPKITSLHLSMLWALRYYAMVLVRSQHNVQALKLVISIEDEIDDEGSGETNTCSPVEVPNDQPHQAMWPAALQTLKLEAVQYHGELEQGATRCIRWVSNDVIPSVTGLGGPDLKSIDLLVFQPKSRSVERERVLSRQWVRAPNDVWQVLE